MRSRLRALSAAVTALRRPPRGPELGCVAGNLVRLNDNGAWSWFSGDRAIVHAGKLIVGSVRAVGDAHPWRRAPDGGNVEVAVHDIASGQTATCVLHRGLEQDDHDAPALLALPGERLLALYTRHAVERRVYWRLSEPDQPLVWGEARELVTPGVDARAFRGDNTTYSNPVRLADGRIHNFFRGLGYDPNYMWSDDGGESWVYGGRVLRGHDGYGPYLRYAFDGDRTVHLVATEDHPRCFDNSIYHGLLRDGELAASDGTPLAALSRTTAPSLSSWDLTRVFQGDPDNVAWIVDLQLDPARRPHILFSIQKDGRAPGGGGRDHRYAYAWWDGAAWHVHEMAHAGSRLYAGEEHYTGLAALDPGRPGVVYVSTNADPVTGRPLISRADSRRHHELFRGVTADGGTSWAWEPITADSNVDNLRPIVPRWDDPRTALVWMRGKYESSASWTTAVVALILP